MNRTKIIKTYLFLLLILCACQTKKDSSEETSTVAETVGFTPNPQDVPEQEVHVLQIGDVAPDFNLPDVSGKFYSLNDFKDASALVIIFTCNHCPTAQAYEDRVIQFTNDYKSKNVAVVGIMPNSVMGLLPEECGYTDLNDSYAEMQIRSKDMGYNFPYLYDGDDQAISLKYGPSTTPHAFVFDADRKLQYAGRLDTIEKPGSANAEDLRNAVDAVLNGEKIENPITKAFGCSVKWGWKGHYGEKVTEEWNSRPGSIKKVGDDSLKRIVSNPSDKLRLINVWATWCAPCVMEYPELVQLQRWYGQRNFEFISLSADNPEHEDKALAFLKSKRSPVKNYLYDGTEKYKMIEAVDPNWNGALPYTLLVAPGGEVVYSYKGVVDMLELKKAIVEHPLMGRYY
jgi:peroxiredoxin